MLVIILIDPGDESLFVNLDWHTDMTLVILSGGFDGDVAVGTDEISRQVSNPDLFEYCSSGGRGD